MGANEAASRQEEFSNSAVDDRTLVDRFKNGNKQAFDVLMHRHSAKVNGLVRKKLGYDSPDAEDLVQTTFMNAHRGLKKFKGDSEFTTWLYRIAVNACNTHFENQNRKPHHGSAQCISLDDSGDEHSALLLPAADRDVSDQLDRTYLVEQVVRSALEDLPEEWRTAFTAAHMQGMEYRDIAAMQGAPVGTVKSRAHRAKQAVLEALKQAQADCPECAF